MIEEMTQIKQNLIESVKSYSDVLDNCLDGFSKDFCRKPELCCSQVVVYASGNCGKTSALWLAILKLTAAESFFSDVLRLFLKSIKRSGDKISLKDIRIAFPKGDKIVYVSTIGDTRDICEDNMCFFEDNEYHSHDIKRNYYIVKGRLINSTQMTAMERAAWCAQEKEKFFVSPCHIAGGSKEATLYCSNMLIEDKLANRIVWLYKERCSKSNDKLFSLGDVKMADEIETLFNRVSSGKLI